MSHDKEKLFNYCNYWSQFAITSNVQNVSTVVLQHEQEQEVLPHLGKTNIIVYTGQNQELFSHLLSTYKPAPHRSALIYRHYDFGQDVIAIGSMKTDQFYGTIESFIPSDIPSSTTRPPQVDDWVDESQTTQPPEIQTTTPEPPKPRFW